MQSAGATPYEDARRLPPPSIHPTFSFGGLCTFKFSQHEVNDTQQARAVTATHIAKYGDQLHQAPDRQQPPAASQTGCEPVRSIHQTPTILPGLNKHGGRSRLGIELTKIMVLQYSNQETSVTIGESVRDEDGASPPSIHSSPHPLHSTPLPQRSPFLTPSHTRS